MAQGKPFTDKEKDKILKSLKPYFLLGYSITKACDKAGFQFQNVYNWVKKDPVLLSKIKAWQGAITTKARQRVSDAIDKGDLKTAMWLLERMEREDFSTKQHIDHGVDTDDFEDLKELQDMMKDLRGLIKKPKDGSPTETPGGGENPS